MKYLPDEIVDHVAAALDEPDLEGTKYRLSKSLGRGGMGSVFEAEDVELGRPVALKVSSIAHGEEMAARLRREASRVGRHDPGARRQVDIPHSGTLNVPHSGMVTACPSPRARSPTTARSNRTRSGGGRG